MWFEKHAESLKKNQSMIEQKQRIMSVWHYVAPIKPETMKDDDELNKFKDGLRDFGGLVSEFEDGYDNQFGVNVIDKDEGIGELYYYGVVDSPEMFESKMSKSLGMYMEKILPHAPMQKIVAVTRKDDYEFWQHTMHSGWHQAETITVLETYNDENKHHDVEKPTADELFQLGLPLEAAKDCEEAMNAQRSESDENQCIMHTVWDVKDDVINDASKIKELEEVLQVYADAGQCASGKRSCSTSFSKELNRIFIFEYYNSKIGFDAHLGYCLPSALKLNAYIELDLFVILCNEDKIEQYTTIGNGWNPKTLIVLESIRGDGKK